MQITDKIKKIKLTDIKPYGKNPKDHTVEQIEVIKKSIENNEYIQPIVIGKGNEIIIGHGRYEALKLINPEMEVECINVSHLSKSQLQKLRILDNRLNEMTGWNDNLTVEIEDIFKDTNLETISIEDIGFDSNYIQDIFTKIEHEGKEDIEDDVPELEKCLVIKEGDIIELGKHRLMCGDSTIKENVDKLMNGDKADMVFTDPPYGVSIGDKNKLLDTIQKAGRIKTNINNDTLDPNDLKEKLKKSFINLKLYSNDLCSYFVTAPLGGELGMMMMMMMKEIDLPVRHVIIWVKNRQCFSFGKLDYEYKHEPILYTWNKKHKYYGKGKYKSSVWDINKEQKCNLHPTMKPVELIENALNNNSTAQNICCDFFLGSGSTLIACEKTGRICYGMEIDRNYCSVIIERYCKYVDNYNIKINGKNVDWKSYKANNKAIEGKNG